MEDCAQAALQVLDRVGPRGPVDWVGNAWGGHVGIVFAARHPGRVRTLVAAATPVHPYPTLSKLSTQTLLVLYRWLGPTRYLADAVAETLLSARTRRQDPAAVDLVRDCFISADRRGLANAVVSISLRRSHYAVAAVRARPDAPRHRRATPDWSLHRCGPPPRSSPTDHPTWWADRPTSRRWKRPPSSAAASASSGPGTLHRPPAKARTGRRGWGGPEGGSHDLGRQRPRTHRGPQNPPIPAGVGTHGLTQLERDAVKDVLGASRSAAEPSIGQPTPESLAEPPPDPPGTCPTSPRASALWAAVWSSADRGDGPKIWVGALVTRPGVSKGRHGSP